MVHSPLSSTPIRWPAIQFVLAGLLSAAVPVAVTAPAIANDYGTCTADLLSAGLDTLAATDACASALHPTEVSSCVVDVTGIGTITAEEALSACSRDRRPDEVASCVTTINSDLVVDDASAVLDTCHRSILPVRFSECVVGLSEAANLATEESLQSCIAAGYRPEDVAPTFVYTK